MQNLFHAKKNSFLFYLIVLFFALIASLRGATRDTTAYKFVYDHIYNFPLTMSKFYEFTGMEIGYGYLAYLFNEFNFPFWLFLFFISFLTFFFIKKASDNFEINSVLVLVCYIPVFFTSHQLMQIRQGLAIAIGYYFLSAMLVNKNKLFAYISFLFGIFFHNIAFVFLLFISNYVNKIIGTKYIGLIYKVIFVFCVVFVLCRILTNFEILQLTDRISNYSDSEYSADRSFFHPANLRSIFLLILFVIFKPRKESFIYNFLTIFYAVGVGFRLGFYDFLILSGRLSTVFTYSEIFLVPILLSFKLSRFSAFFILFIYFVFNLYINLAFQVPFILDDYFKPLW